MIAAASATLLCVLISSSVDSSAVARSSLLSNSADSATFRTVDQRRSILGASRLTLRGGAPVEEAKDAGPKLQIVFVSAEIAPWSVTGGLGAVSLS